MAKQRLPEHMKGPRRTARSYAYVQVPRADVERVMRWSWRELYDEALAQGWKVTKSDDMEPAWSKDHATFREADPGGICEGQPVLCRQGW